MSVIQSLITSKSNSLKSIFAATKKGLTGTPTYVVGFSTWKQYLRRYFPNNNLYFLDKNISESEFNATWRDKIKAQRNAEIFVWGMKSPQFILDFAAKSQITLRHVEDGFIRSVELGSTKAPPMSLTIDSKTPYFNAQKPSDLEELLSTFDFASNPELLTRATSTIHKILDSGVSKYNKSSDIDIQSLYGEKKNYRVLVVGQVEDDASILLGCEVQTSNNDLVRLAAKENPNAQVIYKPHPDVTSGNRSQGSDPAEISDLCSIIHGDLPLSQAFHEVDHVYTVTSLAGFEALLRGIKVTTLGCPFYAGWGVTDDRQVNPRRTRKLTVEQIFAVAYLTYAKYFDPNEGTEIKLESVIDKIVSEKATYLDGKNTPKVHLSEPGAKASSATKAKVSSNPASKTATAPAAKPAATVKGVVPDWFSSRPGNELKQALTASKPVFLYVPWIAGHGDALIEKLSSPNDYTLAPLDFVNGIDTFQVRHEVLKFCRIDPGLYRKLLINRLVPIRKQISGVIFTFDWSPVMSILASVCADLEIPRILIPHESVFVDREKYYWDVNSKASVPVADIVFGWGGLQREIFTERGYPANRFHSVGAPKFDTHVNYDPKLTRDQYCNLFGLASEKKIVLFASQPLDSQLVKRVAQDSQRDAISDLLDYVESHNAQLLVRLPPNKEDILGAVLRKRFQNSDAAAVDDGQCYLVSPEEALYHADVVTSINSTMLFEGVLIGRPALSLKYVEFDQIWQEAGIPAAHNQTELKHFLDLMFEGGWSIPPEGMAWAASMFGIGEFDGAASARIKAKLTLVARGVEQVTIRPSAVERLFKKAPLDVVAIPSGEHILSSLQMYLQPMLNARSCVSTAGKTLDRKTTASAEIFFQWGISESDLKTRQREAARELGRPIVYVEDGFIRSIDIGLSQEPGLSIILDDTTAYYDAGKVSRLSRLYENGPELSEAQIQRSKAVIQKIVDGKVSKYNHAPDLPLKIGKPERRKILLIDQRYGDESVTAGMGSEAAFQKMLMDAIQHNPDCDILIKQHPDAIKGGKSSYFSNERLAFTQYMDNVFPILFDVNPYSLFNIVDEVYVMTSGMGFEALMAGKKVHCYGMPFYAGWGATIDRQSLPSRTRNRSIEEIFYFSYIESSRYYSPALEKAAEIEDVIEYILETREW